MSLLNPLVLTKEVINDLQTVQDAYRSSEINKVAIIIPNYKIVEALTKAKGHSASKDALNLRKLNHPVEQWIVREFNKGAKVTDKKEGMSKIDL